MVKLAVVKLLPWRASIMLTLWDMLLGPFIILEA